jgi:response regulator of citrate/malate metabolism
MSAGATIKEIDLINKAIKQGILNKFLHKPFKFSDLEKLIQGA